MDGNAVIQPEEEEVPHAEAGGAAAPPDFPDPIESLIDANAGDAALPDADGFGAGDFKPFDPFEQPSSSEPQPFDVAPVSSNNDEFQPIDMAPIDVAPIEAPEVAEEPSFGPADDPLNLNEFANSEISAAKDGPLVFRILISGIDTREIRESIREVLEDPRFAWDSNEIFSNISKGHLAIDGLSPVKASILITRIKRLPVEIRWEQYAIAQGQP
jgi:hypothetical protein